MLIEVYHHISKLEELTLKNFGKAELSINEMHLIECVGERGEDGRTIREIAEHLDISSPSVTVAVKKLENRGYLEKRACSSDGRAVRVRLTKEGRCIDGYHSYYHRIMVREISDSLENEEKTVLTKVIRKLNEYLKNSIGASE